MSYFSARKGSIIGAGRLSFRVRDGSGRFPVAMDRRNFIHSFLSAPGVLGVVFFGGGVCLCVVDSGVVWLRVLLLL